MSKWRWEMKKINGANWSKIRNNNFYNCDVYDYNCVKIFLSIKLAKNYSFDRYD